MPAAPLRLFISYSRADSRFVDRLQQDLRLRDFEPWVDRSRLEGGQTYPQRIQAAIEAAAVVLVALSPESVASEWVLDEIHQAKIRHKRIIPLLLRMTDVPMEIARIQYEDFRGDYDTGLTALLRALIAVPATPPPVAAPVAPEPPPPPDALRSTLVTLPEPLAPPDPDLNALLNAGFAARATGDNERTLLYWEQVHEKQPHFGNDILAGLLPPLRAEVRAQRIARLRAQAGDAARAGNWHEAAGAWEALLGQDAQDAGARAGLPAALGRLAEEAFALGKWDEAVGAWQGALAAHAENAALIRALLAVAEQNRRAAFLYDNARGFVQTGDAGTAGTVLAALWSQAPGYGDPQGLAAACGLAPRPSGLAGPWAAAQYEQWMAAGQFADALALAELELRLAPNDAGWRQRQATAQARRDEIQRFQSRGLPARLPALGFVLRRGKTADLILPPLCLVPAGPFWMGTEGNTNNEPWHQVTLPAFQIAAFPITVAEWKLALDAKAVSEPPTSGDITWAVQLTRLDHPVVGLTWREAMRYAAWVARETGQPWRLPTEGEWEKAARWDPQAQRSRVYPWGDTFDPRLANTDRRAGATTPVGTYAAVGTGNAKDEPLSDASPCGAHDLAGNVWEWTRSIYDASAYQPDGKRENDGDETSVRVLRGGAWSNVSNYARAADRLGYQPSNFLNNVGARLLLAAGAGS